MLKVRVNNTSNIQWSLSETIPKLLEKKQMCYNVIPGQQCNNFLVAFQQYIQLPLNQSSYLPGLTW